MPVYTLRVPDGGPIARHLEALKADGVNISKYLAQCVEQAALHTGRVRPAPPPAQPQPAAADALATMERMADAYIRVMGLLIAELAKHGVAPTDALKAAADAAGLDPEMLAFFAQNVVQEGRGKF